MNKLLLTAVVSITTFVLGGLALAGVEITTPLYTVTDLNGTPIIGLTKSTTIPNAMAKASNLPTGSYKIVHGDITVTVTGNEPVVEPPIVIEPPVVVDPPAIVEPPVEPTPEPTPTSDIPFDDISKLQEQGLLPAYGLATHAVGEDLDIAWHGAGGERSEIGLFPEQHAAFLAGQTDLKDSILEAALAAPPLKFDHAHHPNEFWLPYLLTGNPVYIANMEAGYKSYKDWRSQSYDSAIKMMSGREGAWNLRDLAQLAYLQEKGLTEQTYYIDALNATRDGWLGVVANPRADQAMFNILKFNSAGSNTHGFTGWMQYMLGQAINHTSLITKDPKWVEVAEWHFQHLLKSSGDKWPLKATGYNHVFMYRFMPQGSAATWREAYDFAQTATWETITPYTRAVMTNPTYQAMPDNHIAPASVKVGSFALTYANRAQYAYGWAALACKNAIPRACDKAQQLFNEITLRGDRWDYKNGVDMAFPVADNSVAGSDETINTGNHASNRDLFAHMVGDDYADCVAKLGNEGGWCEIGGAKISSVYPPLGANGYTKNILVAWCGAGYDPVDKIFYFFGGGHSDYSGTDMYSYHLLTNTWARIVDSDPLDFIGYASGSATNYIRVPDMRVMPGAAHNYDGIQFNPATRTILYNPSTPSGRRTITGVSDQDPNFIAGIERKAIYEFNPSTDTVRNGLAALTWRKLSKDKLYYPRSYIDGNGDYFLGDKSRMYKVNFAEDLQSVTGLSAAKYSQPDYGDGLAHYDSFRDIVWNVHDGALRGVDATTFALTYNITDHPLRGKSMAIGTNNDLQIWDGASTVHTYRPETNTWNVTHWQAAGVQPANIYNGYGRVYSKWQHIEGRVFAGMANDTTNMMIYVHPLSEW